MMPPPFFLPGGLRDHAVATLCADIRDTKARGFPRVEALRHLVRQGREG